MINSSRKQRSKKGFKNMNKKIYNSLLFLMIAHFSLESSFFTNMLQSSINTQAISNMLKKEDNLTQQAALFWNDFQNNVIAVLNNPDTEINIEDFKTAIDLGFDLEKINELEIFETQYNALLAAVHKTIERINNPIGDYMDPTNLSILDTQILEEFIKIKRATKILLEIIDTRKNQNRVLKRAQEKAKKADQIIITSYERVPDLKDLSLRLRSTEPFNKDGYNFTSKILDDGNCGYRAFLSSIYVQTITSHPDITRRNNQAIDRLQYLVANRFKDIFEMFGSSSISKTHFFMRDGWGNMQYINVNNDEIESIQLSLINQLEQIKSLRTISNLKDLLNRELGFDFYMIMLLRGLIADYMIKNEDALEIAAITREKDTIDYLQDLLRWKTWIDQPELQALNNITNIIIQVVNDSAPSNRQTLYNDTPLPDGQANILFVNNNHYNIIHQIED